MSAAVLPFRSEKSCLRCGLTKVSSEFPRDSRNSDGLMGSCKACENARNKAWQAEHPEKVRGFRRARYGIDFNALWIQQKGMCALCATPMLPRGKESDSVHIDHDHSCCPKLAKSCGKCVRGLIHQRCNFLLGKARDSVEVLKGAIQYLEQWELAKKDFKGD